MRKKVIAGNWKMNKTPIEVVEYMEAFTKMVSDAEATVILCAPYIDLMILMKLADDTNVRVAAQNMHYETSGAYTGEVSPRMLRDIGVEYVIIGHSERREYFNETDETVNKKIKSAFAYHLKPILCVGETLTQREEGITKEVITTQVRRALDGLDNYYVAKTIIAYEPIWAIGTGKTATANEANEAIKWIRDEVRNIYGNETADEIILQYGGSVKPSNAKELFEMSDIDGALVGGASLDPLEFARIVNYNK